MHITFLKTVFIIKTYIIKNCRNYRYIDGTLRRHIAYDVSTIEISVDVSIFRFATLQVTVSGVASCMQSDNLT
jgi:hypothetical protein